MEFTELAAKVVEAQALITNSKAQYDRARLMVTAADDALDAMPTTYGTVSTEVNAGAAANPGDEAWQVLKGNKDHALTDRQTFREMTQAIVDAFQAVDDHGAAAVIAALAAIGA